jgi:DNA polymerase III delta subunit
MVHLLIGDNISVINDFIVGRRNNYRIENIYDLRENYSEVLFLDILNANSLFSSKKLIIINLQSPEEFKLSESELKEIHKSSDTELIIIASNLNRNTKTYKNIKSCSRLTEFSKPKDYINFNISDAVFVYKDKSKAIKEIHSLTDIENEFFPLVHTLYNGIRNIASKKYKNKTWDGLHPYVKNKMNGPDRFTTDEIIEIYKNIFEMDVKKKSEKINTKDLLEDFVLYSI